MRHEPGGERDARDSEDRDQATPPAGDTTSAATKRSEPGPPARDFVRLADEWAHRPDLEVAFFTGYGRTLTPMETALLPVLKALDAVSGIAWGSANGGRDRHLVQRRQHTLARLRANVPTP